MNPLSPEQLRVVLVESQGAANVGAVARTMACFGVRELYLVRPIAPIKDTAEHWAVHGREVLDGQWEFPPVIPAP